MSKKFHHMSESFFIGSLLAVVGGFLDAYTYLIRGNVFANAQTGNIVLLGISLTNKEFTKAFLYILPILAFGIGVILSKVIRQWFYTYSRLHWRQIVLLLEIGILFTTAFMPAGAFDTVVNTLISFICAMQVEGFRKVNGNAYATTMCTGNLRSAMDNLYQYTQTKDFRYVKNFMQYIGIILFFIVGAGLGTIMVGIWQIRAVFICCFILGFCFIAMFISD